MNAIEAKVYGRKVKRAALAAVAIGDCGTIVLNAEWQVCDKARKLGIVDWRGMVDVSGEVARAFKAGFGK